MQTQALIEKKVAAAAPPYAILAITVPLGGIDALARILRDVPSGFRLPIVVALLGSEREGESTRDLPSRLQPHTALPVRWIGHRVPLRAGTISLGVPGESMVVGNDGIALRIEGAPTGPLRSAKLLLESIAASHGPSALGLVLGGTGIDDASGIRSMKAKGATLVAHDEAVAHAWGSARQAVDSGSIDLVLPLERIASTLVRITAAMRRPGTTGAHRCVSSQLFSRERRTPHEVVAVQRAMHRVLGAIEELYPANTSRKSETIEPTALGLAIADELRPIVEDAGRSLLVDCSSAIERVSIRPDLVRELSGRLLRNVLVESAGNIEIRIQPMRLFVQIAVFGADPVAQAVPSVVGDRDELQALHAIVKPLRGHVIAVKRRDRVEHAVWLPCIGTKWS